MSYTTSTLAAALRRHRRAFAVSIVVGAALALGVRSTLFPASGEMAMADAAPAVGEHAAPGHAGHSHDAAPEPTAKDDDEHEGGGTQQGGAGKQDVGKNDDHSADETGTRAEKSGDAKQSDAAQPPKFVPVLLGLGNATCPVMKGDVNGEVFTEWNGLQVGHCCPGCKQRFLKNPESLLDEVSPKWRDAAAAAKAIDAADGKEREALLAKAAKTWTVVRQPVGTAPAAEPAGLLIDVGNSSCPVMGGEVDGEHFSEWNGLRVGHCCPGCGKRFLANPEALLDEVAPDWRAAVAAVKSVNESRGDAREKALAALRKQWKVVREPAPAPAAAK